MNKFFLLLAFATSTLIAQEVCKSPEASIEHLNSIIKCVNKDTKEVDKKVTRQISVRTPSQNNRYLIKRNFRQEEEPTEDFNDDLNNIIISKDMLNALENNNQ